MQARLADEILEDDLAGFDFQVEEPRRLLDGQAQARHFGERAEDGVDDVRSSGFTIRIPTGDLTTLCDPSFNDHWAHFLVRGAATRWPPANTVLQGVHQSACPGAAVIPGSTARRAVRRRRRTRGAVYFRAAGP